MITPDSGAAPDRKRVEIMDRHSTVHMEHCPQGGVPALPIAEQGESSGDSSSNIAPSTDAEKSENATSPRSMGEADFELLRCIGRGTFGRVYLARKKGDESRRLLAMKVLRKSRVATTRKRAEYIVTERKVLRSANHPFVARLRYAFQSPSRLYLVTDFCGGGELLEHLRRLGRFTEPQAAFFSQPRWRLGWSTCTSEAFAIET